MLSIQQLLKKKKGPTNRAAQLARSLSDLFHECDGDDFFVVTDAVKRRLAGPNKQAATPQSVKITPSLRVVRKNNEYCK